MADLSLLYIISSLYYMVNDYESLFDNTLINKIKDKFINKIMKIDDKPYIETDSELLLTYISLLNGLLYTNDDSRKSFLKEYGISPILYLLMKTEDESRDIICLILTNVSSDGGITMQNNV